MEAYYKKFSCMCGIDCFQIVNLELKPKYGYGAVHELFRLKIGNFCIFVSYVKVDTFFECIAHLVFLPGKLIKKSEFVLA